jgi:hypothetical protein
LLHCTTTGLVSEEIKDGLAIQHAKHILYSPVCLASRSVHIMWGIFVNPLAAVVLGVHGSVKDAW